MLTAPLVRFDATLVPARDHPWLVVAVPEWVADELDVDAARFPVRGRLNGVEFRSWLRRAPDGDYVLYVNLRVRQRAHLRPGERVNVAIAEDEEPRGVDLPPALRDALNDDTAAERAFRDLPYERRREIVGYVDAARTRFGRMVRASHAVSRLIRR